MKEFLLKVLTFTGILLAILVLNLCLNYMMFQRAKVPVRKADIWIAGDSHTRFGLQPKSFASAENLSQAAEPYVITFWKLQYLFRQKKPDTVLIGFSHHNLSAFNDFKFSDPKWAGTMFERTYLIGKLGELRGIPVDYKGYYNLFFRKMCLYPTTNHFEFIGQYENSTRSSINDVDQAIQRHFYIKGRIAGISQSSIVYLDSIIQLCATNRVTVVLVGVSVTKPYYDKIPTMYLSEYEEQKHRIASEGVLVLDMTNMAYPDNFYQNADHLNQWGATEFSKGLARYFQQQQALVGY